MNDVPQGVYVVKVMQDSPAEKAGIKVGDIIYKIGMDSIGVDADSLSKIISSKKPGDNLSLTLWRDGDIKTLDVTLSEFSQ